MSPQQMDMRNVWLFINDELLYFASCIWIVKVVSKINYLPKHSFACIFRFREVFFKFRRAILLPLQRKICHFVSILFQHIACIETYRFSTSFIVIIYVN